MVFWLVIFIIIAGIIFLGLNTYLNIFKVG